MLDPIFNHQWLLLLTLCVVLFGLAEAGHRIGQRLHAANDAARKSQIGGVQGAVLGMLGLLLGFTFSMAVARYDARRVLVLKEANTIGTTWLRVGLLPDAQRPPIRQLLREYVEVRLKYQSLVRDPALLAEGLRLSGELEAKLWQQAEAAAAVAPGPLTVSFITTLNELIDTDAERVAAMRAQIPATVWMMLLVVAGSGCFISSYGSGAQGVRSIFTQLLLPGLIIVVIMLVFDLSHSHQGMIGINQQPMLDLKAFMIPQ